MKQTIISLGKRALAFQALPAVAAAAVPAPVDHIVAIDVSGSMYSDLPELRLQLKNKLATLVGDKDTISLIWFSGKGDYGVLVEQLEIRSVRDLSSLNAAIDRYLRPQGLTGFKEPLQEVVKVIDRIQANSASKERLFSLFFMSDGYDNQWSEADILAVCKKLEPKLSNATLVEFGWHCNRPLMTKMAEILGGTLIFSKDLQEYQVTFEAELGRGGKTKKIPLKLAATPALGYAFSMNGESLLTYLPDEDNVVMVPEGTTEVAYYIDATAKTKATKFDIKKHKTALLWSGLATLSQRMESEAILDVLSVMGDVALVNLFASCFSKEDYVLFQNECLGAALDKNQRFALGYDPDAVPKEDAYTVLELLSDLSASEENLLYPFNENFAYQRIGAGSEAKEEGVKFTVADKGVGYPLNGIVWNENKPNVSVRVRVDVSVNLPSDRLPGLPETINTYIYRNYTIVLDGIVHTRRLPMSLTKDTFLKLQANGMLAGESYKAGKMYVLDFPKLPVINRSMVKGVTAEETFGQVLALQVLKGTQKVLKEFRDRYTPKESKTYLLLYGAAGTEYLANLGLTDYNGFNPPSNSVKSGDYYMAKELKIACKGLSSLPKVTDLEAAIAAGKKLKVNEFVMAGALSRIQQFLSSKIYVKAADQAALFNTWIEAESKAAIAETRLLTLALAKRKFSIVVGHAWFKDLPSMEHNSLDAMLPGFGPVTVTATLKEVQVEK